MSLNIRATKKVNGKRPTQEHFSLFYGQGLYQGKECSATEFKKALALSCNKALDNHAKAEKELGELAESNSNNRLAHVCEDTDIIESFVVVKEEKGMNLDSDDFVIKASYMPNDEAAPQRIYDIAMEFKSILDEYLTQKANEAQELPNAEYTVLQDEEKNWYLAKYDSKGEPVIEERKMIPAKDVFNTLYHMSVAVPLMVSDLKHEKFNTSTGKKHLKGAILQLNKDNKICVVNSNNFTNEVNTVIAELSKSFNIA